MNESSSAAQAKICCCNSNPLMQPSFDEDEIDLRELWLIIWARKWLILAITFVAALASVAFALSQAHIYRAEVLLAPASGESSSALGNMAGLASIAGVSLGGKEADKSTIAVEVVKSWDFAEQFIARHQLQGLMLATDGWNPASREPIYLPIYNPTTKAWSRKVAQGMSAEPSSFELFEAYSAKVSISKNKQSGLVSLTVEHHSPDVAKQWAELIVVDVNRVLMQRDAEEAQRNLTFLNQQLGQTSIAGMKQVLYNLLEEQTKKLMLAEANPEYALKTINKAKTPEVPAKPKRALICVVGTLAGGFMALVLVFILHFARSGARSTQPERKEPSF